MSEGALLWPDEPAPRGGPGCWLLGLAGAGLSGLCLLVAWATLGHQADPARRFGLTEAQASALRSDCAPLWREVRERCELIPRGSPECEGLPPKLTLGTPSQVIISSRCVSLGWGGGFEEWSVCVAAPGVDEATLREREWKGAARVVRLAEGVYGVSY